MRNQADNAINLNKNCITNVRSVHHEALHTLGFRHTQSRPDGDEYIKVIKANIPREDWAQYDAAGSSWVVAYGPYDYESIMHYPSNDPPTMVTIDPNFQRTIGIGEEMSFLDWYQLNTHYNCTAMCPGSQCANAGFPNPNSCSTCICPSGYSGDHCDQRGSGCGETLPATSDWQSYFINITDPQCNYWIQSPESTKIQARWIGEDLCNDHTHWCYPPTWACTTGCYQGSIQFRAKNPMEVDARYCCPTDQQNKTVTSDRNLMPVVARMALSKEFLKMTIEYRHIESDTPSTSKSTTESTATSTAPLDSSTTSLKTTSTPITTAKNEDLLTTISESTTEATSAPTTSQSPSSTIEQEASSSVVATSSTPEITTTAAPIPTTSEEGCGIELSTVSSEDTTIFIATTSAPDVQTTSTSDHQSTSVEETTISTIVAAPSSTVESYSTDTSQAPEVTTISSSTATTTEEECEDDTSTVPPSTTVDIIVATTSEPEFETTATANSTAEFTTSVASSTFESSASSEGSAVSSAVVSTSESSSNEPVGTTQDSSTAAAGGCGGNEQPSTTSLPTTTGELSATSEAGLFPSTATKVVDAITLPPKEIPSKATKGVDATTLSPKGVPSNTLSPKEIPSNAAKGVDATPRNPKGVPSNK